MGTPTERLPQEIRQAPLTCGPAAQTSPTMITSSFFSLAGRSHARHGAKVRHCQNSPAREEECKGEDYGAWTHLGAGPFVWARWTSSPAPRPAVGAAGDACLPSARPTSDGAALDCGSSPLSCPPSPGSACGFRIVTEEDYQHNLHCELAQEPHMIA